MGQQESGERIDGHEPYVTVIVPAYNEAASIRSNLASIVEHMRSASLSYELVVVDDGSSDSTGAEAEGFASSHDCVKVIRHPTNFGLGQAIKTGFHHSRGVYVVTFDADLSYSPDHIDRLITTIEATGASVVIASPYMKGGSINGVPWLRAKLSRWANRLLRTLSLSHVSTVTGMVRAYDRAFLKGITLKSVDNQINAEIIYKAGLLRQPVVEIPAHLTWTRDEEETKSRSSSLSVVKMTIDFLFSGFIFRPFMFFILPGAILLALALYALAWAGYHFLTFLPDQSGSLDAIISGAAADAFELSPHSFVIGGIALVFAFQLISVGILSAQNKRYFEELWFQGTWIAKRIPELDPTASLERRHETSRHVSDVGRR